MDLGNIMLNQRSQTQKAVCDYDSISGTGKSIETAASRLVVARRWGKEERAVTANESGVFFNNDENILELVVMVVQASDHTKNHWNLHFKMVKVICKFYLNNKNKKDPNYPLIHLYRSKTIPTKSPAVLFYRNWQYGSKIYMEKQRTQDRKTTL